MPPKHPTVRLRATYQCVKWADDPEDGYLDWGGWCDPQNPWGTLDDDVPAEDDPMWATGGYGQGEPIELYLPIYEAAEFMVAFPGAVWEWQNDCDPSENYRTGVTSQVMLHVDGDAAEAALEIAAHLQQVEDLKNRSNA